MTIRRFRLLAALTLSGLALLVTCGCGGGLPGDAFVSIDGRTISRNTLQHWLAIAARAEGGGGAGELPVPPAFTACIATLRASEPNGQKRQPVVQLRSRCQQRYKALVDGVAGFLITSQWVIDEAAHLGVEVTDAEVHKQFAVVRREGFATAASLEKFLASSGYTVSDLLLRIKLKMLSERIEARIVKRVVAAVSAGQVAAYYAKHRSEYPGQTPAAAATAIRQQLALAGEQAAIAAFTKGFRNRWRPRTDCRAAFVVIDCSQYSQPAGGPARAGAKQP